MQMPAGFIIRLVQNEQLSFFVCCVQVTAPKEEATAAPSEVAEGEDPPAAKAQLEAVTPQKESKLPEDAPKEVCGMFVFSGTMCGNDASQEKIRLT